MNVFYDKSFALKSKIKNFKIFRMLLALKIKKLAKSGTMDRMILGEFAIFHSQGPPGQENHGGTRSMGGGAIPPHVSAPLNRVFLRAWFGQASFFIGDK